MQMKALSNFLNGFHLLLERFTHISWQKYFREFVELLCISEKYIYLSELSLSSAQNITTKNPKRKEVLRLRGMERKGNE